MLEYWEKAYPEKMRHPLFFHHSVLPQFRRPVVPLSDHFSIPIFFLSPPVGLNIRKTEVCVNSNEHPAYGRVSKVRCIIYGRSEGSGAGVLSLSSLGTAISVAGAGRNTPPPATENAWIFLRTFFRPRLPALTAPTHLTVAIIL